MSEAHTDKIIFIFVNTNYKNHSKENTSTIVCAVLPSWFP